jgi:hypothetical protein
MGCEKKVIHVRHSFIKEQLLGCLRDTRVVLFLRGGVHVEGTVRRVHADFVELVRTDGESVEVESNDNGDTLETFNKFFVRIIDIVGFGQEIAED